MNIEFLDVVLFGTYFILLFFSIFWLLVLFTRDKDEGKEEKKVKLSNHPFFTVIVPAYNEEASIFKTLESLVNLDYPLEKVEIIVVNDGSKDQTPKL